MSRRPPVRRASLVLALVLAVALAAAGAAQARVPVPTVRGPIPTTATSHPFGGAAFQTIPEHLGRQGYVEEEYLVSGRANVYSWPKTGAATVRTSGAPYTTRMLVRRPRDRADFSGNVVVEMLNPSNLLDLNIGWAISHRQFLRQGDVWVGITAKPIAIDALKRFDPQRYAALSFANPLPLTDPANCPTVASDSSRTTENGLVWDIYSQVARWLRSGASSNPLAHRTRGRRRSDAERLYGFGYSQTGGYLVDYINAIDPRVVREEGRSLFDGYLVAVAGGAFAGAYPLNQCEPAPPADDPRRQLRDVGVPTIRMMSQSDYLRGLGSRRRGSDRPGDQYRHYEMAGAAHATPDELYYSANPADILKAGRAVPPGRCNEGPRSRFPSSIHIDAALDNLDAWVRRGTPPPPSSYITVRDGKTVLDRFGNVEGGLRSPFLDVPTSTWAGTSTGASFCYIAGHETPFTPGALQALYPTQAAYVRRVARDVRGLRARRLLTAADARRLVRRAQASDVRTGDVR